LDEILFKYFLIQTIAYQKAKLLYIPGRVDLQQPLNNQQNFSGKGTVVGMKLC
jgi:hypothetical protein